MKLKPNFLYAWIFLTVALALHVVDEAVNDFLSLYNPLVSSLNEQMGSSFFHVFTYSGWMRLLIIVLTVLFSLSYFAYQRKKWLVYFSYFYAIIMIANGMAHTLGAFYYSKLIAGVYTSPLLLAGAIYLIWSANYALKSEVPRTPRLS